MWPVGAVSKTMTENCIDLTCLECVQYILIVQPVRERWGERGKRTDFMISAKPIASSTPGIANARSCIIEPIIPFWSATYRTLVLGQGLSEQ